MRSSSEIITCCSIAVGFKLPQEFAERGSAERQLKYFNFFCEIVGHNWYVKKKSYSIIIDILHFFFGFHKKTYLLLSYIEPLTSKYLLFYIRRHRYLLAIHNITITLALSLFLSVFSSMPPLFFFSKKENYIFI